MATWQFYRHMPVYTRDGRRLGHVEEVGHAVDYLHIQQGARLVRDWYVPIGAVRDVTVDGVFLSCGRAELRRQGWNIPADDYLVRQGATPGYEYTSKDHKERGGP
jgi:hypothetical protein